MMKGAGRCLPTVTVFREFKQLRFERRMSTGSEFFFLCAFSLMCSKSRLKSAKSTLPVDVRRSKTSLLKLPFIFLHTSKAASCSS